MGFCMDPSLPDLERLLSQSRPQPRADFVADLEDSLLKSVRPRRLPHLRLAAPRLPRLLAVAGAGALALVLLALALGDGLPHSLGGSSNATAQRQCTTVKETRLERRPALVVGAHNRLTYTYHTELVRQPVIRCR
jgi:hypothetical protein